MCDLECPAGVVSCWDSSAVDFSVLTNGDVPQSVNTDGKSFTLYLLPAQPANTFSFDATGAQAYADLCNAAGLRTVVEGGNNGVSWDRCVQYGCIKLTNDGGWTSPWVHNQAGWDRIVTFYPTGVPHSFHSGSRHMEDGWDVELRPVCGRLHCTALHVTDAGFTQFNGIYHTSGITNGKPTYALVDNPAITIYYAGGWWNINDPANDGSAEYGVISEGDHAPESTLQVVWSVTGPGVSSPAPIVEWVTDDCGARSSCSADGVCACDNGWYGAACDSDTPTFPGGQLLTTAMDTQLQAWLVERGLANADGWTLCYSSPNGDPKDDPSEWHSRCDGHVRTVVVGRNSLGYTFGGYSGSAWDDPVDGWIREDTGQFIFRLDGPGLAAEAFDYTTGSFQWNNINAWPNFGNGADLRLGQAQAGQDGTLGAAWQAYCNQGTSYQGSPNEVCGGGVGNGVTYGPGAWGETEMEMWYAVPPPLPDPNTDAFLQAQPEIAAHSWVKCFDSDVDDASTPAVFHANCDPFDETVSIARNSLGFTFGGYAERSWNVEACCADSSNYCHQPGNIVQHCYYSANSTVGNFLVGLNPTPADRFETISVGNFQLVMHDQPWPIWGGHYDLRMGTTGALGTDARCWQGNEYAGTTNLICGGEDWGETRLQVWRCAPLWRLGSPGESCDTVCTAAGTICSDGEWGVGSEATMRAALTGAGVAPDEVCGGGFRTDTWSVTPAININWQEGDAWQSCSYTASTSTCDASDLIARRLCLC